MPRMNKYGVDGIVKLLFVALPHGTCFLEHFDRVRVNTIEPRLGANVTGAPGPFLPRQDEGTVDCKFWDCFEKPGHIRTRGGVLARV